MPAKEKRKKRDELPTYPNLASYIQQTGERQTRIAARCGTTQAHISRIAAGDVVPRSLLAARIASYCRIPLDSFTRVHLAKFAERVAS